METAEPPVPPLLEVAERLPTAPRILAELGELMNDAHVESDDVVAVLRQDPPLTAQLIRMANSAAYASPVAVGSLERALVVLGFAEVHRLVGAVAAAQMSEQGIRYYPVNPAQLRLSTLFTAVLMEELARWTGERPRSSYAVGLLRPIGIMALERLGPRDKGTPPFAQSGEKLLDEWERRHWGLTNVEAAGAILAHWRLPAESVLAIRHHYEPLLRQTPMVHMLAIAAATAAACGYEIPGQEPHWQLTAKVYARAGLDPDLLPVVTEKAQRKFAQLNLVVG
jgi:HD-like signal output (HDOD) protein